MGLQIQSFKQGFPPNAFLIISRASPVEGSENNVIQTVKFLFIGDIVGKPGRKAVNVLVPQLRAQHRLDFVVANGENACHGSGITKTQADEIYDAGVDVITCGDHLFRQREVIWLLMNEKRFVRPINYPPGTPGQESVIIEKEGLPPFGIINAQGRTFMAEMDNPFLQVEAEVAKMREKTPILFLDFHAEATSEKIAMGRMLDGQVSAVIGTHTHVQTADEQIFPGGTAFMCDAGFTGPHTSVIGREITPVVKKFKTCLPQKFDVATEGVRLQGAIVEVDNETGKAVSIERVSEEV